MLAFLAIFASRRLHLHAEEWAGLLAVAMFVLGSWLSAWAEILANAKKKD